MQKRLNSKEIALGARIMGLSDWKISVLYEEVYGGDGERYGHCVPDPSFKAATITLFTKTISEAKGADKDSLWGVFLHELGEAFACECFQGVDDAEYESKQLTEARDRVAEGVRHIVARSLKAGMPLAVAEERTK